MKRVLIFTSSLLIFFILVILAGQVLETSGDHSINRYESLFDDSVKHEFHIYMTQSEWLGLGKDIRRARRFDDYGRTGHYRLADIVYKDINGEVKLENVGIRTKGNTTRLEPQDQDGNFNRASFKLKFDYSTEQADYDKRLFFTLNELYLKAQINEDTSYVREDLSYELFQQHDVMTSKASYAAIIFHIGDEVYQYGVYTMIEPINKVFLEKRYPDKAADGNLYKCLWQNYGPATLTPINGTEAVGVKDWVKNYRPSYDLQTNTTQEDYSDIVDFTRALFIKQEDDYIDYLQSAFQIKAFLRATAINVLVGMPDDYWAMGNNYYLYFDPLGKIYFLPYDYDNVMGTGWDGGQFGGYEGIADADLLEWNDTAAVFTGQDRGRPLIEKTLKSSYYRDYYLDYLEKLTKDERFTVDYVNEKMALLKTTYGELLNNDVQGEVELTLGNIGWYINAKKESILRQLAYLRLLD